MGKKEKKELVKKFSLFVKLSRRIPNTVNISEYPRISPFVYKISLISDLSS